MRLRRNERGQAIVETALMTPFIVMLIFAIAEFGFAFYSYVTVNNATSEAARHASVANDPGCADGQIGWRAQEMSRGLIDCDEVTVGYHTPIGGNYDRGSGVVVRVEHTYDTVTPFPALLDLVSFGNFPRSWTISTCSDARLEGSPSADSLPAGTPCSP
jgi:hypothetical protein